MLESVMSSATTVVSAVVLLGILIFVHELGHFLAAKWCGVGVQVFSLGFGPSLWGFTRGGTNYRLSALPLGGYVRMVGEAPGEEVEAQDLERSFSHKPVGKRLLIVAAGPLFNLLFALVAFYLLLALAGLPQMSTVVGGVAPGQPAEAAGLQEGDIIRAVNGQPVTLWPQMVEQVRQSQGRPLILSVERRNREMEFTVTPLLARDKNEFGEEVDVYRVGIMATSHNVYVRDVSLLEAAPLAWHKTWEAGSLIFTFVIKLITGGASLESVGGPIKIAQITGQAAQYGLEALCSLAALLSVNLAILNLLPIPALDGGHLLFFSLEALTRRTPSLKFRERAQQLGVLLLLALMGLVFYNDIASLVSG
jgi:regulator of sigma E protease